MTSKLTFFVGLNDQETKQQRIPTLAAAHVVENIFTAHNVDGATITNGRGVYRHDDGTVTTEETIIVTVFEFDTLHPVPVVDICDDIKGALNQESVAVERTEVDSRLY